MTPEQKAEYLDTIAVCEAFLEDAQSDAAKGGPLAWIFTVEATQFAEAQIKLTKNMINIRA